MASFGCPDCCRPAFVEIVAVVVAAVVDIVAVVVVDIVAAAIGYLALIANA